MLLNLYNTRGGGGVSRQKITWSQMSVLSRLKNPGLENGASAEGTTGYMEQACSVWGHWAWGPGLIIPS